MIRRMLVLALIAVTVSLSGFVLQAWACPFCAAVSQTFTEEIDSMDVVAIAQLEFTPVRSESGLPADPNAPLVKSRFKIVQVLKGSQLLAKKRTVEVLFFGEGKKGDSFLMMAVDPSNLQWSTPTRLTQRGQKYIQTIMKLPQEGSERLVYFQDFLEDKDEMLARDSYDEFAKAPYAAIQKLKPQIKHAKLVSWIKDPQVPASRRRLYLTMLGVCGDEKDALMLAEMLKSDDRKVKGGLNAMIASYLTLVGPKGMTLIEDLYLKNAKSEYADTYAAIMALRFHGTEAEIIPQKRIIEGLRHMLERPDLADLVIVDLARWEDWEAMPRLLKLFKEADEKSSWVRVPIVRYLMACPLPEAKQALEECRQIDAGSVKRAETFFPFGGATAAPAEETKDEPKKQPEKN